MPEHCVISFFRDVNEKVVSGKQAKVVVSNSANHRCAHPNMEDNMPIGEVSWLAMTILLINFAILAGWPLLALLALFSLRGRGLTGAAQAVWVLTIVAVPFLGSLAYLIMQPRGDQPAVT